MKICLQMLYTQSWVDIAKITMPNVVNYCRKHNYSWNVKCIDEPYDAFEKILQILTLFKNGEADLVMSIDCDCLITNYNHKVESVIDSNHSFWITSDVNGINGGVFIVKKSDWSIRFLEYLLSFKGIALCEQDAINLYMVDNPEDTNICVLPQEVMNGYHYRLYPEHQDMIGKKGDWKEGDYLLHLPGVGMEDRLRILKSTPIIK